MSFLAPAALALSALAAPIVLMYILKLRRQEQEVSSTLLWQRALDDVQANAPWQRLRPNLLLLFQILALAALVLMLAQPAYSRTRTFAGDVIIIVDQSYGMQAHDVAPSRFAAALRQAHTIAAEVSSGSVVSVIGMGSQPHLAIVGSEDQGAIGQAIDSLHDTVSAPNFLAALSFASSLARSGSTTHAVVLTSRDSGITSLPIEVTFPVEIVRIGGHLHDLGIAAFSAAQQGGHTQAILRVTNFGTVQAQSDLQLSVDGQLADVQPLTVDPGKEVSLSWSSLPLSAKQLQAHLVQRDDVAEDKTAWAVTATSSPRHILLVTKSDYFLQTALSIDPSVQLSTITPDAYQPAMGRHADVVVFDGYLPSVLPPAASLVIGPPGGSVGSLRLGNDLPADTVTRAPGNATGPLSALLRYVDLSDVHVGRARALLASWLTPVAVSGHTTLIAAGEGGGTRTAVITFGLQESDWPLRISFPIMMQNLLNYLAPGLTLGTANLLASQPVALYPAPGTRTIDITRPDGSTDHLQPPFAPYANATRPGIYTVHVSGAANNATLPFAVNFYPPRSAPAAGPPTIWLGQGKPGTARALSVPVSVAWAVGLLALILLTAEWWLAFRR